MKKTKKVLTILGGIIGISAIAIGAGIGVVSCSSSNQSLSQPVNSNTSQSSANVTNTNNSKQTSASNPTTTNKQTSSITKEGSKSQSSNSTKQVIPSSSTSSSPSNSSSTSPIANSTSSNNSQNNSSSSSNNSKNIPSPTKNNSTTTTHDDSSSQTKQATPNPYPNGLVSISSFLASGQNGNEINLNEYACGSDVTLSAKYTFPTVANLNKNGQVVYTWYKDNQVIDVTDTATCQISNLVASATYWVSANYSYFVSKDDNGTFTCNSSKINLTVNYDNVRLLLSHNDGNTNAITTSNQTTLDATLQYELPNAAVWTDFSSSELALLTSATITYQRYDFNQWWTLNDSSNDNGTNLKNFEFTTTPDGIYPFQALFTFGNQTFESNLLKVNTNYNGTVLSFNNLPTSVLTKYNFPLLMQKYIVQSMSEPNSLFMQLVNAQCTGYRIIPITTNNNLTQTQYNELKVSASDFSNISVKWFNSNNHHDGLLVSATINTGSSLELYSNQNYDSNYNNQYQAAITQSGNYKISDGNIISWLLPYGANDLQWWSNPTNVLNQTINWNLNSNIYMQNGGVLFNSNFDTAHVSTSNWQFYTPNWMYSSISYQTISKGVYWGFTITTPDGSNALARILSYNYSSYSTGNGNYSQIYGSSKASYIAYNSFPMIQSGATDETGYLTLLSSCKQMLQDLYNASIKGISTLN